MAKKPLHLPDMPEHLKLVALIIHKHGPIARRDCAGYGMAWSEVEELLAGGWGDLSPAAFGDGGPFVSVSSRQAVVAIRKSRRSHLTGTGRASR